VNAISRFEVAQAGQERRTMPTTEQASEFVSTWIEAWNRHDLDSVMAMVSEDVEFISPYLPMMTTSAEDRLHGKPALRGWFSQALENPDFKIDPPLYVFASPDSVVLVEKIGDPIAANVFFFDEQGLVKRSIVHEQATSSSR